MKFVSLQSGSAGNCFLIQSDNTNLLIDIGIDKKKAIERLHTLNIDLKDIDAVLITHEHSDHIKSISMIDPCIIYATKETLLLTNVYGFNEIKPYKIFKINDLHIVPLSISHDCNNGVGYLILDGKETLLYLTDTGIIKKDAIRFIKNCTHYIIESNYDEEMLMSSKRPSCLKKRISGNKGHLSNIQCGNYLSKIIGNNTKSILLAHISGDCNNPELCINEVTNILKDKNINLENIEINVASRCSISYGRKEYEEN